MCQQNWKKLSVFAVLIFLALNTVSAAVEDFPKGILIPKVSCQTDAEYSYALYLPSSYSPSKQWPIIYVFDPAGRGQVSAEVFRTAAEEYGYIVAASNDSRNGPGVPLGAIIKSVWDDTHSRLSIDERRVYGAGMSGGARVAIRFGFAYEGLIAGVIVCSGGYPPDIKTSTRPPFSLFGTAGTDDFNHPELVALDGALERSGASHRVVYFPGGHEWPPPQIPLTALAWMEIQAMKAGRRPNDESLVDKLFQRAVEEVRTSDMSGDDYSAYLFGKALVEDFSGLREVGEFQRRVEELKRSKEVREGLESGRRLAARQQKLFTESETLVEGLNTPEQLVEIWSHLRALIKDLRGQSQQTTDSGDRRVARRVLNQLFVHSVETATELQSRRDYAKAATRLEVVTEISPNQPNLLVVLARVYSANGRKKKAIETLKRAAAGGFCDVSRIEGNTEFEPLRNDPDYQTILAKMRKANC
ncbi:MAG TPA: tetratricopeptide repeat protein [Pyrinomonadaceae bacterium]|nr:tetratricopeptide repeat protein [Pyrinomonadaceae bacterium]